MTRRTSHLWKNRYLPFWLYDVLLILGVMGLPFLLLGVFVGWLVWA